jgi:AraC-like DNA-binding protein
MTDLNDFTPEINLCLSPGVRIVASVMEPTGGSAFDPCILLNERAHQLQGHPLSEFQQDQTYDTYDGQNHTADPDWYALTFPEPVVLNCLEMTMGLPYADGGWWASLAVEYRSGEDQAWTAVEKLTFEPDYPFEDLRGDRYPYETYALIFPEITCQELRLIGRPGGSAQFTSLARIAAYRRDFSRWNPTDLVRRPAPSIFELVSPEVIWDLSENLVKLTGLPIGFGIMQYFLDGEHFAQHLRHIRHNYEGLPDLDFLLGETIGWQSWHALSRLLTTDPGDEKAARVVTAMNGLIGRAVAPVVIDGQVIGSITTHSVMIENRFDEAWHQQFAREYGIAWDVYLETVKRTPQMTLEQIEGAAGLLGTIANTIANLAHRNRTLERELKSAKRIRRGKALYQQEIVRQAIDFMQANLEMPIGVEDVAQEVALSVPHLNRMFAEQIGRSPGNYLIDLRLARAKEYLSLNKMSVMDVCVALNYSPSYFSRLFKSRVGCTPGQYAAKVHSA